jgi:Kef-type K+ transport system membrane component KefB
VAGLAGLLSIVVPFSAGLALAGPLHALAPQSPTLPFSLFLAVSMSITAFPVLARIFNDQGLTETRLGHIAIAALNDVIAWTRLAWITALTRFGRWPRLRLWNWPRGRGHEPYHHRRSLRQTGAHRDDCPHAALFQRHRHSHQSRLIGGAGAWPHTAAIVAAAIGGKVGGAFLGCTIMRFGPRDSLALGVPLNTRGLVESIALNVGLDPGILSPPLFSMMVLIALTTTLMTVPLLRRILPRRTMIVQN